MNGLLQCENLSLMRGGRRVLTQVCAAFPAGQITAITGPNGAGKSSLLMALAGLLNPEAGTVHFAGRSLGDYSNRERACKLGYLPQSADIAWDVTAEALVTLGRMAHGDAASERGRAAITAAFAAAQAGPLRHSRAQALSGGERARVLLARVLAGEPEVILADEPLAALDLAHQLSLIAHFKASAARGTGIVLVLHDLALAMNHADNVVVLDKGECITQGPPQRALSPDTIEAVWGVKANWIGEPGAQALAVQD